MPARPRSSVIVVLTLLVVLAGCGSAATGGGGDAGGADVQYEASGGGAAATATPMATPQPETAAEDLDAAAGTPQASAGSKVIQQRAMIRTGRLRLEVSSFDATRRNLTETTRSYGGFVSDTTQELHHDENRSWTTGTIVLRVPAGNFSTVLERAKAEGTVKEVDINQRDVTDQLVDIEARLENLRAERKRLRTLYEQAHDTEEILKVQERLADVQGQIERIEARQRALQQKVAFSTLRVHIAEPRPEPPADPGPPAWYETGVVAAFLESASGVVTVLRALVVGFAFALPYLLVFGVPVAAILYVGIRHHRHQSTFDRPGGGD
ncbi:MAG: DUF4349 domain-containing protein [Halobacteriales archaeon]|nr:DUF4349 domain-containing protein [Halobacteriales archaeon]